jgi:Domain of unknown function (DUF4149)
MRNLLNFLVTVAWALWIGGTIATFVFGLNLFHKYPDAQYPGLAGQANSAMFLVFGWYELALAAVAIAGTGALIIVYPSKPTLMLVLWLMFAGGVSLFSGLGMTPRMEILRTEGKAKTVEFQKLHAKSMIAMTTQSLMLLRAGRWLLRTIKSEPEPGVAERP